MRNHSSYSRGGTGESRCHTEGRSIVFSEVDPEETDTTFAKDEGGDLTGFGLVVDAADHKAGELIESASAGLNPDSGLKMKMRAALLYAGARKPKLTPPFPVVAIPIQPDYVLEYQDPFGTVFDCHSHWFRQAQQFGGRRFTNCHGPCPAGQRCSCWRTRVPAGAGGHASAEIDHSSASTSESGGMKF